MARKATNTKSRILQMTRTLYSTHGSDGTTLEDIITAAGITKGAFYHYFKSKDALTETVIENVIRDYKQLADDIDPLGEPIDRLHEMISRLADLNASGEWVNCRLILRLSMDSNASHPHLHHKIHEFWEWEEAFYGNLIDECRAKGQLTDRLDAETQKRLLMSVMAGAITLEKIAPSDRNFGDLVEAVIDMMQ